jgi:hypothetical protein
MDGTSVGCVTQPPWVFRSCARGYFRMACRPESATMLVLLLWHCPLQPCSQDPWRRLCLRQHPPHPQPSIPLFTYNRQFPVPRIPSHSAKQNTIKAASQSAFTARFTRVRGAAASSCYQPDLRRETEQPFSIHKYIRLYFPPFLPLTKTIVRIGPLARYSDSERIALSHVPPIQPRQRAIQHWPSH